MKINIMKKIISFILIITCFATYNLIAQKKCEKEVYSVIDEFTKEKKIGTRFIPLVKSFLNPIIFMAAQNRDGIYYLRFSAISTDVFSIQKGDPVLIKANNGNILKLNWQEEKLTIQRYSSNQVNYRC